MQKREVQNLLPANSITYINFRTSTSSSTTNSLTPETYSFIRSLEDFPTFMTTKNAFLLVVSYLSSAFENHLLANIL